MIWNLDFYHNVKELNIRLLKDDERFSQIRKELGLTQKEFADLLGVSQRDISKLERGKYKNIPQKYFTILHCLGYSADYLYGFSNTKICKT